MCLWFIDTYMLNWQTENRKNYNNKIITVKRHAKTYSNHFLRRYANMPKIYSSIRGCYCFFLSVFVVRLRSIFYAFSSIWFQIDAIRIYWNCHHSFDWFGILLRKILGSFSISFSLSLCLSHTHKKILFGYLHIWTLFIHSIYECFCFWRCYKYKRKSK